MKQATAERSPDFVDCRVRAMDGADTIPIIFAANNQYTPYTGVAISSVIFNCSPNFTYRIYVLSRDMTEENAARLEGLGTGNISVQCVNVSEQIKNMTDFCSQHLTQESVYRLLIPELFSQYEKVIYLDSDLIVLGDIADLYQHDLDGYLLAAAHNGRSDALDEYYQKNLGIDDKNIFCAGVLLMNLPLLRESGIKDQCLRLLEEDAQRSQPKYEFLDQDVLNLMCHGKVLFLDTKWNLQCAFLHPIGLKKLLPEYRDACLKAAEECEILHFVGINKPWNCSPVPVPKTEEFWKIARRTIFYEELCHRYQESKKQIGSKLPLCNIKRNSKIILYGAGTLGTYLWEAIHYHQYCQIVLWVDQNAAQLSAVNKDVREISEINGAVYDEIVISVGEPDIKDSIVQYLLKQGVPEEKIVWAHQKNV